MLHIWVIISGFAADGVLAYFHSTFTKRSKLAAIPESTPSTSVEITETTPFAVTKFLTSTVKTIFKSVTNKKIIKKN